MFAYCGNNPVNHVDILGYYTDGQIHDFVIENIVDKAARDGRVLKWKRWDTYILYDHMWRGRWFGFCDLYDPITGEVWELKKASRSYSCSTKYAKDQLDNYINNGFLTAYPNLKRTLPKSVLPGGKFSKYDNMNNEYVITYWYEGSGILRYSYYIKPSKQMHFAVAVAVAAMTSGAACGKLSLSNETDTRNMMLP